MNFEKIPPVENNKQLIDIAFRRAREHLAQKKLSGDQLTKIKTLETSKIDVIKDVLCSRLTKVSLTFPYIDNLNIFYQKLFAVTIDIPAFKKSVASLTWATTKIKQFQKIYNSKINRASQAQLIRQYSAECYGRISSILKQINPQLLYLEECRRIMRTYPDIKEMYTVCLYGFPNVGKSTLLNNLTNTKAQVAAYAFTTKTINAGYLKPKPTESKQKNTPESDTSEPDNTSLSNPLHPTIQVLDVPGTLDRKNKLNVIEQQADIVLHELSNIIVFVFDLSEYCGYSIKAQEKLLQTLHSQGKKRQILIYFSKIDLTEPELLKEYQKEYKNKYYTIDTLEELKTRIIQQAIKETPPPPPPISTETEV